MSIKPANETTTCLRQKADQANFPDLRADDLIGDLFNHPAFAGFGHLLLPWDCRTYDMTMRLFGMHSLLPYHSHVDSDVVVSSLNRMITDAQKGQQIFYDFHNATRHPARSPTNTGLFFFRGKPGAPFAIIAPGGGFEYVGSLHEGFPYAVAISNRGYNAFVLRYRTGQGEAVATEDLAAAVSFVFRNADVLDVDVSTYSLWGSSAGARMAAAIGSWGVERFGGDDLPKPAAIVMAYTGHQEHTEGEPPTFVAVGERDTISPPHLMENRVRNLREMGTSVEYHCYPGVEHGFGLGTNTNAQGWIENAIMFWERQINGAFSGTFSPKMNE
jgi:acetyl esterase/lipase